MKIKRCNRTGNISDKKLCHSTHPTAPEVIVPYLTDTRKKGLLRRTALCVDDTREKLLETIHILFDSSIFTNLTQNVFRNKVNHLGCLQCGRLKADLDALKPKGRIERSHIVTRPLLVDLAARFSVYSFKRADQSIMYGVNMSVLQRRYILLHMIPGVPRSRV